MKNYGGHRYDGNAEVTVDGLLLDRRLDLHNHSLD